MSTVLNDHVRHNNSALRNVRTKARRPTGYRPNDLRILPPDEEDNVPLAGIDIVILQEEQLVDPIFLERAEFDKEADDASKGALDDQVLLASDLKHVNESRHGTMARVQAYSLEEK